MFPDYGQSSASLADSAEDNDRIWETKTNQFYWIFDYSDVWLEAQITGRCETDSFADILSLRGFLRARARRNGRTIQKAAQNQSHNIR